MAQSYFSKRFRHPFYHRNVTINYHLRCFFAMHNSQDRKKTVAACPMLAFFARVGLHEGIRQEFGDMRKTEMQAATKAKPFKPFQIRLADGEKLPVDHPDYFAHSPDWAAVLWVTLSEGSLTRNRKRRGGQTPCQTSCLLCPDLRSSGAALPAQ